MSWEYFSKTAGDGPRDIEAEIDKIYLTHLEYTEENKIINAVHLDMFKEVRCKIDALPDKFQEEAIKLTDKISFLISEEGLVKYITNGWNYGKKWQSLFVNYEYVHDGRVGDKEKIEQIYEEVNRLNNKFDALESKLETLFDFLSALK